MFENAKWICQCEWTKWDFPKLPAPYVVRDFNVKKGVKKATLNICAIGQGAFFVNGVRIPDSIIPTQCTTYEKAVAYNTYDITEMLCEGENRLGVIIGHVGYAENTYYLLRSTLPRMIAQLDIEYISGESETINSDSSFWAKDSYIEFAARRCGEIHNTNMIVKDWCIAGTSLEGWNNAVVTLGPGGVIRETRCPNKRIFEEVVGVEIAPGLYDFGRNLSGYVRLDVKGKHDEKLVVRYSEWLTEDKQHVNFEGLQRGAYPDMLHKDVYNTDGESDIVLEPMFTYHGFRYVEITGNADVTVTAVLIHTDIKPLSSFECSVDTFNKIFIACRNSILQCCQGAMLDCPQREQNEWTGDAMLTAEVISREYDAYGMYYEFMQKIKEEQRPNGYFPGIVPPKSNWTINFANGIDWMSVIFHVPYYAYKFSGNPDIVNNLWDNMELSMELFEKSSESRIMNFSGLGDWIGAQPRCNKEITETIYYYIAANMLSEMAEKTGRDATKWQKIAAETKEQFRAKYVADGKMTDRCVTALLCAVYSGMLEESEIQWHVDKAARIIAERGYWISEGIHTLRTIFDVFGKYGHNDTLFKILTNPNFPGYAKAMKDGLQTLPEIYTYLTGERADEIYPSLNHHFTAMVNTWFIKYVSGIDHVGFGSDEIIIKPYFVDGIDSFKTTVRGVTTSKEGNVFKVSSDSAFTLELDGYSGKYEAGEYEFNI